jgi:sec-independent protein translocase protein TatC
MTEPKDFPPPQEQPFLQHLIELRDRLLRVVLVVALVFLGLFPFANKLYSFLASPLLQKLPHGSTMIATGVISPFLTPFKLALVTAIFISIPFILYQAWSFIAPGLYKRERRLVFPLLISSTVLFYLGMVFAYYVVFPLVFKFMATQTPAGVTQAPDISLYLDFALKLFFAFGVAFEVPIATILLVWTGLVTPESLAAKRPYIIVVAFVVGMLLTPPDVISQTLLAVPMLLLFELGLLFSRWYAKNKESDEGEEVTGNTESETGMVRAAATASGATERVEPAFSNTDQVMEADDESEWSEDEHSYEPDDTNESGHEEFEPLTEEQMDAELDRIEAEEAAREDEERKGKEGDDKQNL